MPFQPKSSRAQPAHTALAETELNRYVVYSGKGFGVRYGDRIYSVVILLASLSILAIIVWISAQLFAASQESIHRFGFKFITGSVWDESRDIFGILPFIFGTLYSSFVALIIAVPISVGAAVFLSELAPPFIRTPLTFLVELLAAIPSVVYGLWGIFVMLPWIMSHFVAHIENSRIPHLRIIGALFAGASAGPSMLAASLILAIMVIPYITAVSRDILKAIPRAQREGSLALGSTQWETISKVVVPYAKSGIIGGVILGLGRALGETMAVALLIGNSSPATQSGISWSLFDPGYTMTSALANGFGQAQAGLVTSAYIEIGLVLFLVTIFVNAVARLLVRVTARSIQG